MWLFRLMSEKVVLVGRSESIKLSDRSWNRLHALAATHLCTVGPRRRPSWRILLRRIADGKVVLSSDFEPAREGARK